MLEKERVGKNLRSARQQKHMTQQQVCKLANLSTSQLSAYENGKQLPGTETLAAIAQALDSSLDELCFGSKNESFITSAPSKGHAIVNCIAKLWREEVIKDFIELEPDQPYSLYPPNCAFSIEKFPKQLERLLRNLNEFKAQQQTYSDPENYERMFLTSVAKEIDDMLENGKDGSVRDHVPFL